jgi:hypothetical protein
MENGQEDRDTTTRIMDKTNVKRSGYKPTENGRSGKGVEWEDWGILAGIGADREIAGHWQYTNDVDESTQNLKATAKESLPHQWCRKPPEPSRCSTDKQYTNIATTAAGGRSILANSNSSQSDLPLVELLQSLRVAHTTIQITLL